MISVEKRIVRVAQWGGDIMFKNIALVAIFAVAVTSSALANSFEGSTRCGAPRSWT